MVVGKPPRSDGLSQSYAEGYPQFLWVSGEPGILPVIEPACRCQAYFRAFLAKLWLDILMPDVGFRCEQKALATVSALCYPPSRYGAESGLGRLFAGFRIDAIAKYQCEGANRFKDQRHNEIDRAVAFRQVEAANQQLADQ